MNKAHSNINWENRPSDKTPINEQNLNKMDVSIDEIDDRVIVLDTTKLDKIEAQQFVKSITLDRTTGIFTITYFNGSFDIIDTLLEKIAVNFGYDATTQKLSITLDDGTVEYIDLAALITQYEFLNSDTIAFQVQPDGKIKAVVKEGSIEEKHLRPEYLADIRVEVARAESAAASAEASASNAAISERNAKISEENAGLSKESAEQYKTDAETAAGSAKKSEDAARESEINAESSKNAAKDSENSALSSAQDASASALNAGNSAEEALNNAASAENFSEISKSYAVGTDGNIRPNDSTDNSKFYSELAQSLTDEAQKLLDQAQKIIAAASQGALIPAGTIAFENLPEEPQVGYMYNISNDFITDERFVEGSGISYRAGANIYWTKDNQWDVMVGVQVTGVKGNAETEYRIGNVNLTAENVNALDVSGGVMHGGIKWEGSYGNFVLSGNGSVGFEMYHQRGSSKEAIFSAQARSVQSGSGVNVNVYGNSNTANRLSLARTIRTNLASTSTANFDGSANITPGVTGILPIANGGTGNSEGTVASATTAITATTAGKLGRSGNPSTPMTFYWTKKNGQPSQLWGGDDGTNMYAYDPANFFVDKARRDGNGNIIADTYAEKSGVVYKYASGTVPYSDLVDVPIEVGHSYLVLAKCDNASSSSKAIAISYLVVCPDPRTTPAIPNIYKVAGMADPSGYFAISVGSNNGLYVRIKGATSSVKPVISYSIYDLP